MDNLLFSRIGVPLFHRYRVFDRAGTHGAFSGTYMRGMHTFLEESDAASLRMHIAARMSRTSLRDMENKTPDVSSRPRVFRRSVSRVRRPTKPVPVTRSSMDTGTVRPHRSEGSTIRALMDLALPTFDSLGDRPTQVHRPWMVKTDSPASPDPVCSTDLLRSPSPCLNLEALPSDDAEESVGLSDISVTLLCGSDDGHIPINSYQVLSDEDLPAAAGSGDQRQVIRIRDVSPDISQVGRVWDSRQTVWGAGHPKDIPGGRMQRSACVQASATKVGMGWVVFPAEEITDLSTAPRAPWAAKYMAAMGLWHPHTGPGDPGPVPASSCNSCMNCRYCFPEAPSEVMCLLLLFIFCLNIMAWTMMS